MSDADSFDSNREFLKDTIRQKINFSMTAQSRHIPAPPLQKPSSSNSICINLPDGAKLLTKLCSMPVGEAIIKRQAYVNTRMML